MVKLLLRSIFLVCLRHLLTLFDVLWATNAGQSSLIFSYMPLNSGVSFFSTNLFRSFFHLLNRPAILLRAKDLINCSLTGFSGSSSGGRVKFDFSSVQRSFFCRSLK